MENSFQASAAPRIRRARAFRLYDVSGRRFLDLWQAGGGAVLGHRAARTGAALKAALDRGLSAPLPTAWESRLICALAARFPSYRSFRLFATRERALEAGCDAYITKPVDLDKFLEVVRTIKTFWLSIVKLPSE